jgi:hypothetical protein
MNNTFEKKAGIALLIFSFLLIFTMVMHPAGGSIEYIIKITNLLMITHAIAIFSLPFGWIGFWGLTRKIGTGHFWPMLAFAMISIGLVAVMIAAATNGLIFPLYLQHYKNTTPEIIESIKPVIKYGFEINHAFDYIYTGAFCFAMLCWSIGILITKKLPVWIAWFGIVLAIAAAIIFISGMALNHLQGFRIFISSIVIWIVVIGFRLMNDR